MQRSCKNYQNIKRFLSRLTEKQVTTTLDDDFDDDADDLDKIKGDIMKVLSKLDQAEVE